MNVKIDDLTGRQLNYMVAKARWGEPQIWPERLLSFKAANICLTGCDAYYKADEYNPCKKHHEAGEIIELNKISIVALSDTWSATTKNGIEASGSTYRIAALRAYVADKFGQTVMIPDFVVND